jgi:hypothetical protein
MDKDEQILEEKKFKLEERKVNYGRINLFISVLTPIVIAIVGLMIQNAVNRTEHEWKTGERRAEQREKIYTELAPNLNIIYCYANEVGDYTSYSPPEIIAKKRFADRMFYDYYGYWSAKTKSAYDTFMVYCFETNKRAAKDALIRTGSYHKRAAFADKPDGWDNSWNAAFSDPKNVLVKGPEDPVMKSLYIALVNSFLGDLEVNSALTELDSAHEK